MVEQNLEPSKVRQMGLEWLALLNGPLDFLCMWFGEDQRANVLTTHIKRDWTTSSNINNYSILNSEHNSENLCIKFYLLKIKNKKHTHMIIITNKEKFNFHSGL
jgi:hypothetical protein